MKTVEKIPGFVIVSSVLVIEIILKIVLIPTIFILVFVLAIFGVKSSDKPVLQNLVNYATGFASHKASNYVITMPVSRFYFDK